MKATRVKILGEYPHGTPVEEVMGDEIADDRALGVQLWRHVIRRLRILDHL